LAVPSTGGYAGSFSLASHASPFHIGLMKHLVLFLLPVLVTTSFAGNFFGPGPINMGGYWPTFLDGKYQAAVTGVSNNIAGVVGFALINGAPPGRQTEVQSGSGATVTDTVLRNVNLGVDPFQNYFMIFVDGRTYAGVTSANINLQNKTVIGALQGTDPVGNQPVTLPTVLEPGQTIVFPSVGLSVLNRGLNGGFQANLNNTKALMSFSGTGSLSTPSQRQIFTSTSVPAEYVLTDNPPSPPGTITNVTATAQFITESVTFLISGMRTSYFASDAVSTAANDFGAGSR